MQSGVGCYGWTLFVPAPCYVGPMNVKRMMAELEAKAPRMDLLREMMEEAAAERDDFATLIFTSRKQYWHHVNYGLKSGKDMQRCAESSYAQAQKLGYTGGFGEWRNILSVMVPRDAKTSITPRRK